MYAAKTYLQRIASFRDMLEEQTQRFVTENVDLTEDQQQLLKRFEDELFDLAFTVDDLHHELLGVVCEEN